MAGPINPDEVYAPPIRRGTLSDEALETFASLLDDVFNVPGTRIRFGLDALIGLVPGLGDIIAGLASFVIVFVAWQRGLPRVTQLRMLVNIGIDTVVGAIPFLGDAFDVAWKSNRKNVELLKRVRYASPVQQQAADWLFLVAIFLVAVAVVAVPIFVLVWIIQHFW